MSKYIPKSRPQITKEEALQVAQHNYGNNVPPLLIIGVRGYYPKSMGATEVNDFNLYDDAAILIGDNVFKTFNFNTDPSFLIKKGREMAVLDTGKYKFYRGKHKGKYNALRAYPEGIVLPCTRNGKKSTCRYINIHKGGMNPSSAGITWSEGCPSVPTSQWNEFIETVYSNMTKLKISVVDCLLIDNDSMLKIIRN